MARHLTVDQEGSTAVDTGMADLEEEPIKPWYHFKGDAIAQGYNLVGPESFWFILVANRVCAHFV